MKFSGKVVHGNQVGNRFGIATANLDVIEDLVLEDGVYLVFARLGQELLEYPALLHIGERKTFGGGYSVEVHILNFDHDIYDDELSIEVLQFLRENRQFENADALFTQIEIDIVRAEKFFLRQRISQEWVRVNSHLPLDSVERAVEKIVEIEAFRRAEIVLAYAPEKGREIEFVKELMFQFPNKKWFFPVSEKDRTLSFYQIQRWNELGFGRFGILEPIDTSIGLKMEEIVDPIFVFIPTVGADSSGNRLGRGRGYYDRFIVSLTDQDLTYRSASVIPSFALVESIPIESHDQKIHQVIVV